MLNASTTTAPRARKAPPGPEASNISLDHAVSLYGGDDLIAEVVTITPDVASAWLKSNQHNRPVRRRHVAFLANEITRGNWQVNGQAIVISENESILDGQHRLMAIIEAGESVRTLVVYGISAEAFATIDTGAVRTGTDALCLNNEDVPVYILKCAATAAQWCHRLEKGNVLSANRLSNTDIIAYVKKHQSILQYAETLAAYPRDARPLSLGPGCALYEMFARKKEEMADDFMKALYTGENVTRVDPEWLLRESFLRDATRTTKLPCTAKVKMVIKGWNWRRRGVGDASRQVIAIRADDDPRVRIL